MEMAKGKQRSKWKEEFERQLDATEAAVLERDGTIEALTAEIKDLKKVSIRRESGIRIRKQQEERRMGNGLLMKAC